MKRVCSFSEVICSGSTYESSVQIDLLNSLAVCTIYWLHLLLVFLLCWEMGNVGQRKKNSNSSRSNWKSGDGSGGESGRPIEDPEHVTVSWVEVCMTFILWLLEAQMKSVTWNLLMNYWNVPAHSLNEYIHFSIGRYGVYQMKMRIVQEDPTDSKLYFSARICVVTIQPHANCCRISIYEMKIVFIPKIYKYMS